MSFDAMRYFLFFLPSAMMPAINYIAQVAVEPEFQNLVEKGGYVLPICLLVYGLKYLINKLDKKEKQLEDVTAQYSQEIRQSVESRVVLANSIDKQAQAIEKMSNVIEKIQNK